MQLLKSEIKLGVASFWGLPRPLNSFNFYDTGIWFPWTLGLPLQFFFQIMYSLSRLLCIKFNSIRECGGVDMPPQRLKFLVKIRKKLKISVCIGQGLNLRSSGYQIAPQTTRPTWLCKYKVKNQLYELKFSRSNSYVLGISRCCQSLFWFRNFFSNL